MARFRPNTLILLALRFPKGVPVQKKWDKLKLVKKKSIFFTFSRERLTARGHHSRNLTSRLFRKTTSGCLSSNNEVVDARLAALKGPSGRPVKQSLPVT